MPSAPMWTARDLGAACERLRQIASAKVFDDDLVYVPCALGSNWQVMKRSNEKAVRRAVRRGATEANGQMVHHCRTRWRCRPTL